MADPRHLDLLVRLHPRGAFDLDEGSVVREDLAVLAEGFDEADDHRIELLDEALPDRVEALLASYERVYGIKRTAGKTDAERRAAILAYRRLLPDFRPATLDDILTTLTGVDVVITEFTAFRCDHADSVCDATSDRIDGTLGFFADFDRADAFAAGLDRGHADDVIERLKPAHVFGGARFDAFCCDDAYSLTDRDLLGV